MASLLLVTTGYAITLLALVIAFAERNRRLHRWTHRSLLFLAVSAGVAATLYVVQHRVDDYLGDLAKMWVYGPLLPAFVVCWISILWWSGSTLASACEPHRLAERPDVDFSFLESSEVNSGNAAATASSSPRKKLDHRSWIERLKKIKVMHRWSFLTDPP